MNYNEYLKTANEEEIIFINELYNQGQLSEEGLEGIRKIDSLINILVITSPHCKDSATLMPFLIKLAELNTNIKVDILLKSQNENLLKDMSKENMVPTFMIVENDKTVVKRKLVEFTKGVKEILINNPKEKTQEIIDNMRGGKYNSLIQKDMIAFITGKDYEYISFQRKDK